MIGNDKYLRYKEIFSKWVHKLESYIKTLSQEKNDLSRELCLLEERYKSVQPFNIGKFDNLADYTDDLINQYNEMNKEICKVDNFLCFNVQKENIGLEHKMKIFAEHILKQKNKLIEYIGSISKQEENIQALALEKNGYKLKQLELEKLKALKNLSETYKELDYCRNKLEIWKEYENKKKEMEYKIKELTERNKWVLDVQARLKQIIDTIGKMLISDVLDTDFDIHIMEKKMNELINWCSSKVLQISDDKLQIEVYPFTDKILKINGYIFKIDNLHYESERNIVLNNELKNLTIHLREKVESLIENLRSVTERYINNQSNKKKIEKDIDRLNKQDKSLKQILMETLKYLDKHSDGSDVTQLCPVCRTPFSKEELITRIKDQITGENDIIKEKIVAVSIIDEYLKQDLLNMNAYKSTYDKAVNEYKDSLIIVWITLFLLR